MVPTLFTLLVYIVLKILARETGQDDDIKKIQVEMWEIKFSLFEDNRLHKNTFRFDKHRQVVGSKINV